MTITLAPDLSAYIRADGTRAFTGPLVGPLTVTGDITATDDIYADNANITGVLIAGWGATGGILFLNGTIAGQTDLNTSISWSIADSMLFSAGGVRMLSLKEGTTDEAVFNDNRADVNLRWESDDRVNATVFDAGKNAVLFDIGIANRTVVKTSAYTVTTGDYLIYCSGTWILTLLTASSIQTYIIKNNGSGTITVTPTGGELIEGAANYPLAAGESIMIQGVKIGTYRWHVLASYP